MSIDPETILQRLIVDHRTFNAKGEQLKVTGTVSLDEAHYIRNLIVDHGFTTCLETGVAYGASTVAICHGLSLAAKPFAAVKHYGVDPCEINVYGGPALAALKECGLDHIFELCEGPSHMMLPKLIDRGVALDFVLIDGMHTYDYSLVDMFFADKLLRPGGIICMHDMWMRSKQKVFKYLMGHRKYLRLSGVPTPFPQRFARALRAASRFAPKSTWSALRVVEEMLVVQKLEQFEPKWDFYAPI
jgi:predicted O-methyltransferase YrrM